MPSPPEESTAYLPRAWTPPGELTPEEQAQQILDAINDAISSNAGTSANGSKPVTTVVASPSIVQQPVLLPAAPTGQEIVSPEVTTVKALEQAGPAPTTVGLSSKI